MRTKNVLITILLFIIILIQLSTTSFATFIPVTRDNLTKTFEKLVLSEDNYKKYDISVLEDVINITLDNESSILNYDLSDKPTFSNEIIIEKGINYDDYKVQEEKLILPMLGYVAVANIQGVEFEDATSYFLLSYLESALKNNTESDKSYVIYDDTTIDGTIIDVSEEKENVIYKKEFGERVIEYVNAVYPEKQKLSDAEEANSYEFTIEKLDVTETSCKLVSTLVINTNADFSKIKGTMDGIEDSFTNSDITKENADYTITLKVGQKCKIETVEKITGYELYGNNCVDFSEDYLEITAIEEGDTNGYLYLGEEKKAIYITVEENTGNATLETITLTIGKAPDVIIPNDSIQEETKKDDQNNKDNTVASVELPKAGVNNVILFILGAFIISIIAVGANLKKYRDII